jgi:hypothetical protein
MSHFAKTAHLSIQPASHTPCLYAFYSLGHIFKDDVNGFTSSTDIYILNIEDRLLIFITLYFVFLFSLMQYDSVKWDMFWNKILIGEAMYNCLLYLNSIFSRKAEEMIVSNFQFPT